MNGLGRDCIYAFQRLWRAPGFTAAVIATLALGIGVNSALFSLANGVLFGELAIPNLDRLVAIGRIDADSGKVWSSLNESELAAILEARLPMFQEVLIHDSLTGPATANGFSDMVSGELVSGNYFRALEIQPRLGRLLEPADDYLSAPVTAVVISERMWRLSASRLYRSQGPGCQASCLQIFGFRFRRRGTRYRLRSLRCASRIERWRSCTREALQSKRTLPCGQLASHLRSTNRSEH